MIGGVTRRRDKCKLLSICVQEFKPGDEVMAVWNKTRYPATILRSEQSCLAETPGRRAKTPGRLAKTPGRLAETPDRRAETLEYWIIKCRLESIFDLIFVICMLKLSANIHELSANIHELSANKHNLSANIHDLSANIHDLSANMTKIVCKCRI